MMRWRAHVRADATCCARACRQLTKHHWLLTLATIATFGAMLVATAKWHP